jgi:hypothetical protein
VVDIRKQEMITTIRQIQKKFSVEEFDNKFVSIIKFYLNSKEDLSYYDMRNNLDMEFNTDLNPLIMYIINNMSLSYPDISIYKYIKVIDKIKFQYGSILHLRHETTVNPLSAKKPLETEQRKKTITSKVAKLF